MKIIVTGATGFAGGEVLRQSLDDPAVEQAQVSKDEYVVIAYGHAVTVSLFANHAIRDWQ